MLTGGPNYMMIRRAIFGKVHGRGVKEIWPISQFPAKHKGAASGPKIVFARPGLARLLGYGYGVINNEFIRLYSLLAPKWLHFVFQRPISYCMTLSDQILCSWYWWWGQSTSRVVKNTVTWAFTFKTFLAIGKKEGAFKNTTMKCHFKFHFVTVRKFLWIRPNESSLKEGEVVVLLKQFQFARKLKVTKKYWANCRIHARRRKKVKNNFLFKVGWNA